MVDGEQLPMGDKLKLAFAPLLDEAQMDCDWEAFPLPQLESCGAS